MASVSDAKINDKAAVFDDFRIRMGWKYWLANPALWTIDELLYHC